MRMHLPMGALVGQEPSCMQGVIGAGDMWPSLCDGVLSPFLHSLVLKGGGGEPQNLRPCLGSLEVTPKNPNFGAQQVPGQVEAVWERLKLWLLKALRWWKSIVGLVQGGEHHIFFHYLLEKRPGRGPQALVRVSSQELHFQPCGIWHRSGHPHAAKAKVPSSHLSRSHRFWSRWCGDEVSWALVWTLGHPWLQRGASSTGADPKPSASICSGPVAVTTWTPAWGRAKAELQVCSSPCHPLLQQHPRKDPGAPWSGSVPPGCIPGAMAAGHAASPEQGGLGSGISMCDAAVGSWVLAVPTR